VSSTRPSSRKIDRRKDRTINFPAGDYTIFTRQNPAVCHAVRVEGRQGVRGLRIDYPERFWERSRF
jgi:hypothetical protein